MRTGIARLLGGAGFYLSDITYRYCDLFVYGAFPDTDDPVLSPDQHPIVISLNRGVGDNFFQGKRDKRSILKCLESMG
jgi:hypothetical protein